MSNRWETFGEEIRKTVQDAVEHQDYEKLNEAITETVNQAVNTMKSGMKTARNEYRGYKTYSTKTNSGRTQTTVQKEKPVVLRTNQPSKIAALLQAIFGCSFGGIWLFATLIDLLVSALVGAGVVSAIFGSIFAGIGIFGLYVGIKGVKKLGMLRRFESYRLTLGSKEYCNVSELADKEGRSSEKVVKDLEYMIRNRWFVEGHLDKGKTCLMVTDAVYEQYRQLEQRKALEEQKPVEQSAVKQEKVFEKELSPEVRKVIELGDEYVRKIRKCNDDIPGEEISEKIDRMEHLVDRIFDRVEQNPKCVSDIQKLMDYYLPTTVKLLEAYADMDAQPTQGENIRTAKKEIEATLDTLNIAFEQLLDSLFQDTAWDVSSDISVLNTMLAQEGLKKKDFE